jgi:membrane-associated protease RseP (regulator of RpoE activity)
MLDEPAGKPAPAQAINLASPLRYAYTIQQPGSKPGKVVRPLRDELMRRNAQAVYRFDPSMLAQGNFLASLAPQVLGLQVQPASEVLRAQLGLPEGAGLVVVEAAEGSEGAKAGIKKNDILLSVGETELKDIAGLQTALSGSEEETVSLTLLRKGEKTEVEVPTLKTTFAATATASEAGKYFLGIQVGEVDEATREQVDIEMEGGLVVLEVVPESPAAKAEIQKNDIIVKMDGEVVVDPADLIAKVQEAGESEVEISVVREGDVMVLKAKPAERPAQDVVTYNLAQPAGPGGQFQFFGPGVMVQPDGTIQAPGGQFRAFSLPPGQAPTTILQNLNAGDLSQKLDELTKKVDALQKQLDTLKKREAKEKK